jgi:hypothetical protein
MLSSISWTNYLLSLISLTAVYYAAVISICYRSEMFALFSGSLRHKDTTDPPSLKPADHSALLGAVKPADFMSSNPEEMHFDPESDQQHNEEAEMSGHLQDCPASYLLGSVPDFLKELEITFQALAESGGDLPLFEVLFTELLKKYPEITSGAHRRQVVVAACEMGSRLPSLELSEDVLNGIWDQVAASQPAAKPMRGFTVAMTIALLLSAAVSGLAQDGNQGITEAANKVKGYFDTGTDLMYAIGAVVGLVGAVKVYSKWNAGEPDTGKVATAWFGSCIFLVVVATVLQSFFGI